MSAEKTRSAYSLPAVVGRDELQALRAFAVEKLASEGRAPDEDSLLECIYEANVCMLQALNRTLLKGRKAALGSVGSFEGWVEAYRLFITRALGSFKESEAQKHAPA